MIREIEEEVKFLIKNPILILLLLTVGGLIPSLIVGVIFKILGL